MFLHHYAELRNLKKVKLQSLRELDEPQRKNKTLKVVNHETKYWTGACVTDGFLAWCLTGESLDAFF